MRSAAETTSVFDAAYQGRPGAYSEAAARALVGSDASFLPCQTLEETFAALAGRRAKHAVVPVENTLAGTVTKAYDLLLEHDLTVIGEHVQRIDHVLIGRPGATLGAIRRVLSHPVALAQCEHLFRRHPALEPVPVFDTAGAVPLALDDMAGASAAIASRDAARLYGGHIIADQVQDHADNFTRFVLVATDAPAPKPGDQKTIIALRLPNSPGALWSALEPFAREAVNLTKIESRPVPDRPFEYAFILEVHNNGAGARIDAALDAVADRVTWLRVLGTFAGGGQ